MSGSNASAGFVPGAPRRAPNLQFDVVGDDLPHARAAILAPDSVDMTPIPSGQWKYGFPDTPGRQYKGVTANTAAANGSLPASYGAMLPPTATSSVDINTCDLPFLRRYGGDGDIAGTGYSVRNPPPLPIAYNPNWPGGAINPGGGGINPGGGGGRNLTPPPRTYGPGEYPYIELPDGSRRYAHPRHLAPGVMFQCDKGFFDLRNPGAGWQDHPPR